MRAAAPQQPEWADRSSLELCLGLKQHGARFGGLAALKQWMTHRFKEEKVVLVVPSDPYTGAGHDDQRLYARVLLNWTETEQLHISYFVSDPKSHVVELQIVHAKMLVARQVSLNTTTTAATIATNRAPRRHTGFARPRRVCTLPQRIRAARSDGIGGP